MSSLAVTWFFPLSLDDAPSAVVGRITMMLRLATALVSAALLGVPASASGQVVAGDSVTGTVTLASQAPAGTFQETYAAASGPGGENPTGSVAVALLDFGVFLDFQVTCLAVTDNRAVIGMLYVDPRIGNMALYRLVIDGGPGVPDSFGIAGASGTPTDCATVSIAVDPSLQRVSGDAVVTDAKPFPTSKDQCKHGGWRNFPGFKNQGECVTSVRRGPNPQT